MAAEGTSDVSLAQLSLDDEHDAFQVFKVGHEIPKNAQKSVFDQLLQASQAPKTAKELYEILLDDAERFLHGIYKVNDTRGLILINTIRSFESREDLIASLLNTIRAMLSQGADKSYYLSVYLSLVSSFERANPQHLGLFLLYLVPKHQNIASLVLMIIVKNLNSQRQQTVDVIHNTLEIYHEDDSVLEFDQFINFVMAMEMLFPILPEIVEPIYCSEKTKKQILGQVAGWWKSGFVGEYPNQVVITTEILKLVSSSCITESARTFNAKEYYELLKVGCKVKLAEIRLLATLGLVKVWNFVSKTDKSSDLTVDDLLHNLVQCLKTDAQDNHTYLEYVIEGLAYVTLTPGVRSSLRNDEDTLEIIVSLMKRKDVSNSLLYGLTSIISNLTQLQDPAQSKSKETASYLNSFANPGESTKNSQENQQDIQLFNKSLIVNHKILDVLTKLKTTQDTDSSPSEVVSNSLANQLVVIIYMISMNQERLVRNELVKQGGLTFLLSYLIKYSAVQKDSGETRPINSDPKLTETRTLALKALAKVLIAANPKLAFSKYDVRTSVPFLVELLGADISTYTGSLGGQQQRDKYLWDMTNLDKYESLMALTNLSSDEANKELRILIINKSFKYLDNFIVEVDNPLIQKASWELVTNLISEPSLLVRFFNIDGNDKKSIENRNRLELLVKLLNSQDESLQIVIAGLLANATAEFEMISQILVKHQCSELKSIIGDIFLNQANQDDLILRVSYLLMNIVYSVPDVSVFSTDKKLVTAIASVIKQSKNPGVLEVLTDVLKLLK